MSTATPPCPHFGRCGGCQLQHLDYASQLEQKAARLTTLLTAANLTLPPLEVHASPPLGYRNRIRLTLAESGGQLRAGYLTSPSPEQPPEFLPVRECPIAAPLLWRAAEELLAHLEAAPAHWLRNPQFRADQLELFTTADESALQFTLYLRSSAKVLPAKLSAAFAALCDGLRTAVPALTGAGLALLARASAQRSRRTEVARTAAVWGTPGLNYAVEPGLKYWVPRGAFFQVNRFLLPELIQLVTAGRSGELAWDLYAGIGLFSRALAPNFQRITAVEIAEPAATALATTRLVNLRVAKATTLDFLRAAVLDRDRPSLVILDPPRTGAGAEICSLLARIAAPTLVYVSCAPENLALDLLTLTASGYKLDALHLLDLFPQTSHIESIALLSC